MEFRELNDVLSLCFGGAALVLISSQIDNTDIVHNLVFYGLVLVVLTGFVNLIVNQLSLLEYDNISFIIAIISLIGILVSLLAYFSSTGLIDEDMVIYFYIFELILLVNTSIMIKSRN